MQPIAIIDRGRGPEIAGTRTTVFDLLPYLEMGWHPASVALLFNLSAEEVTAAVDYYRQHEQELKAKNRRGETERSTMVSNGRNSAAGCLGFRERNVLITAGASALGASFVRTTSSAPSGSACVTGRYISGPAESSRLCSRTFASTPITRVSFPLTRAVRPTGS